MHTERVRREEEIKKKQYINNLKALAVRKSKQQVDKQKQLLDLLLQGKNKIKKRDTRKPQQHNEAHEMEDGDDDDDMLDVSDVRNILGAGTGRSSTISAKGGAEYVVPEAEEDEEDAEEQ